MTARELLKVVQEIERVVHALPDGTPVPAPFVALVDQIDLALREHMEHQ